MGCKSSTLKTPAGEPDRNRPGSSGGKSVALDTHATVKQLGKKSDVSKGTSRLLAATSSRYTSPPQSQPGSRRTSPSTPSTTVRTAAGTTATVRKGHSPAGRAVGGGGSSLNKRGGKQLTLQQMMQKMEEDAREEAKRNELEARKEERAKQKEGLFEYEFEWERVGADEAEISRAADEVFDSMSNQSQSLSRRSSFCASPMDLSQEATSGARLPEKWVPLGSVTNDDDEEEEFFSDDDDMNAACEEKDEVDEDRPEQTVDDDGLTPIEIARSPSAAPEAKAVPKEVMSTTILPTALDMHQVLRRDEEESNNNLLASLTTPPPSKARPPGGFVFGSPLKVEDTPPRSCSGSRSVSPCLPPPGISTERRNTLPCTDDGIAIPIQAKNADDAVVAAPSDVCVEVTEEQEGNLTATHFTPGFVFGTPADTLPLSSTATEQLQHQQQHDASPPSTDSSSLGTPPPPPIEVTQASPQTTQLTVVSDETAPLLNTNTTAGTNLLVPNEGTIKVPSEFGSLVSSRGGTPTPSPIRRKKKKHSLVLVVSEDDLLNQSSSLSHSQQLACKRPAVSPTLSTSMNSPHSLTEAVLSRSGTFSGVVPPAALAPNVSANSSDQGTPPKTKTKDTQEALLELSWNGKRRSFRYVGDQVDGLSAAGDSTAPTGGAQPLVRSVLRKMSMDSLPGSPITPPSGLLSDSHRNVGELTKKVSFRSAGSACKRK